MDTELRHGTLDVIHEGWECPRCGAQLGHGSPNARLTPPTCSFGHARVEMEQILPGRFGAPSSSTTTNGADDDRG